MEHHPFTDFRAQATAMPPFMPGTYTEMWSGVVGDPRYLDAQMWKIAQPQKQRLPADCEAGRDTYSRKDKSLGLLCRNFMAMCKDPNFIRPNGQISLDQAATYNRVERRRIYDIVNVLESLEIVSRQQKNNYLWLGLDNLPAVLKRLKTEGQKKYGTTPLILDGDELRSSSATIPLPPSGPQDTAPSQAPPPPPGGSTSVVIPSASRTSTPDTPPPPLPRGESGSVALDRHDPPPSCDLTPPSDLTSSPSRTSSGLISNTSSPIVSSPAVLGPDIVLYGDRKEKSLGKLSQHFIQLFLLSSSKHVLLENAARTILGPNADAAMTKTKTRRLYDIANILISLGLIKKKSMLHLKKPAFVWQGCHKTATAGRSARCENAPDKEDSAGQGAAAIGPQHQAPQHQEPGTPSSGTNELNPQNIYRSGSSSSIASMPVMNSVHSRSTSDEITPSHGLSVSQSGNPVDACQLSSSQLPSSQRPASQFPASQFPAPQPSVSQNPISHLPISHLPTSQHPISQLPASQHPISHLPASQHPISQLPTSQHPMSQLPASQHPVSHLPTSQYPISHLSTSQYPNPQPSNPHLSNPQLPASQYLTPQPSPSQLSPSHFPIPRAAPKLPLPVCKPSARSGTLPVSDQTAFRRLGRTRSTSLITPSVSGNRSGVGGVGGVLPHPSLLGSNGVLPAVKSSNSLTDQLNLATRVSHHHAAFHPVPSVPSVLSDVRNHATGAHGIQTTSGGGGSGTSGEFGHGQKCAPSDVGVASHHGKRTLVEVEYVSDMEVVGEDPSSKTRLARCAEQSEMYIIQGGHPRKVQHTGLPQLPQGAMAPHPSTLTSGDFPFQPGYYHHLSPYPVPPGYAHGMVVPYSGVSAPPFQGVPEAIPLMHGYPIPIPRGMQGREVQMVSVPSMPPIVASQGQDASSYHYEKAHQAWHYSAENKPVAPVPVVRPGLNVHDPSVGSFSQ